jgi:hypothetical protein
MRPQALLLALLLTTSASFAQSDTPADKAAFSSLDKSMESAPPQQRLVYNALLVTFITFRDAHLRHEVCVVSSNCWKLQAAERARLNQDFLLVANGFSGNTPPTLTADDLTSADESLNASFDRATTVLPESCTTTDCLSKSTLQEVERDWIRYRDALVTFGTLRFPAISSETWRTYLTRQRSAQLLQRFPILKGA